MPVIHNNNVVADAQKLVQLWRNHDDALSLPGKIRDNPVNFFLYHDVDTLRRFVDNQDIGTLGKPLSKDDLKSIFNIQLATFLEAWKWKEWIKLPKFTAKQVKDIIEKIYDPQYGARPVERYIQNDIEWELINSVLEAN